MRYLSAVKMVRAYSRSPPKLVKSTPTMELVEGNYRLDKVAHTHTHTLTHTPLTVLKMKGTDKIQIFAGAEMNSLSRFCAGKHVHHSAQADSLKG